MPLLLVHYARFGPYHHARLDSAAAALVPLGWEVIGLETAGNDSTYAWDESSGGESGARVVTAFPGRVHEEITAAEYRSGLPPLLDALQPDAIAIAGWGSTDSQLILAWCRKHDVRRIVMSETREADGKRVWWKELLKRYLISRFHGALVGGRSHRDYLVKLGMPAEKIRFGYNVVDNAYFENQARAMTAGRAVISPTGREVNESDSGGSATRNEVGRLPYFLASNRFIERKNLGRLIEAYSIYVRATTAGRGLTTSEGEMQKNPLNHLHLTPLGTSGPARRSSPTWHLCLLGDGELKADLIAQCHKLGLNVIESAPWESYRNTETPKHRNTVFFPGFRQIGELPCFYALAGCFVHPALEEPWGLVLNEAMACGLPILSGDNVGAAEELVDDGVNGWKFDAENVEEIAKALGKIAALNERDLLSLGDASRRIVEERCPRDAFGRGLAEILKR